MQRRKVVVGLGAVGMGMTLARPALARSPEVYMNAQTGIAINGADPVAYFTKGKPVNGVADFTADWKGAKWLFASAENLEKFQSDPDAFAPRYGGYCAFAMAHNAIAPTVPEAWSVHKGRLYLNFSTGVRQQWRTDPDHFIELADGFWPGPLG